MSDVREFFNSWRFRILAVVALLLLGLMLHAATSAGASVPGSVIGVVVSPVQKLSATISDAATNFLAGFTDYSKVKKENDELKKQMAQITSKLVNYDTVVQQNQQYKSLLGLHDENLGLKYMPSMVISRDPGPWFSAFSIDKGSLDGIQKNDPVETPDGLVGYIAKVMPTTSVVTTLLDPSSEVGAIISRTSDICISQGTRELAADGLLKVIYIPRDSGVSKGDVIITSGIGGMFPRGLKIGTVQDIKLDTNGMSLYAVAQPMVNLTSVKSVMVITSFKGKASDISASASAGADSDPSGDAGSDGAGT